DARCFSCARSLEHLGAVNVAAGGGRRLQESFRYPLNPHALTLIIAVSVLSIAASHLPLSLLWTLILTGAFMKYSFSCLENTARGLLVPPDISDAYDGGLVVMFHLYIMLAVASGSIVATAFYMGFQAAILLSVLLVIAAPAMIIIYGLNESLLEA